MTDATIRFDPDAKPTRLYIMSLQLRLAVLRVRVAWGCWLGGTTVAELRRVRRLNELTGRSEMERSQDHTDRIRAITLELLEPGHPLGRVPLAHQREPKPPG